MLVWTPRRTVCSRHPACNVELRNVELPADVDQLFASVCEQQFNVFLVGGQHIFGYSQTIFPVAVWDLPSN